MPRVPQFESQVQDTRTNVRTGGVQAPQIDSSAEQRAGQRIGQAGQDLVNIGIKIQAEENKKADRLAINMAEQTYSDQVEEILYSPNGYMLQTGSRAMNDYPEVSQQRDRIYNDVFSKLTPRQQELFHQRGVALKRDFARVATRHYAVESQKSYRRVLGAQIESYRNKASREAFDENVVKNGLEDTREKIKEAAIDLGWSKEETDISLAEESGRYIASVANSMLIGDDANPQKAQDFVKKNDKYLTADARVKLNKVIGDRVLHQKADNHIMKLREIHGKDYEAASDKIKQIKNEEERVITNKKFKQMISEMKYQDNLGKYQRFNSGRAQIDAARASYSGYGVDVRKVLDPDLMGTYSPKEVSDLEKYASGALKTNQNKLTDFNNLDVHELIAMDEDEFRYKYARYMGADDYKTVMNKYKDARKGKLKKVGGETQKDFITRRLMETGLFERADTKKARRLIGSFNALIDQEVTEAKEKKEDISLDKVWERSMDRLLRQVYEKQSFFGIDFLNPDDKQYLGLVEDRDPSRLYVEFKDIQESDINSIRKYSREERISRGLPPKELTQDEIARAYVASIVKDGELFDSIAVGE